MKTAASSCPVRTARAARDHRYGGAGSALVELGFALSYLTARIAKEQRVALADDR